MTAGATTLPVNGAVYYPGKMGVLRPNETIYAPNFVLSDLEGKKEAFVTSAAAQYGVSGVPMNFFINPQGKVVAFATGYRKWDSKEGLLMIEQLIASAKSVKTGK